MEVAELGYHGVFDWNPSALPKEVSRGVSYPSLVQSRTSPRCAERHGGAAFPVISAGRPATSWYRNMVKNKYPAARANQIYRDDGELGVLVVGVADGTLRRQPLNRAQIFFEISFAVR